MIDVTAVKKQAEKEVREERQIELKEKLKSKMRERDKAKQIVENLNREIDAFLAELS